MITLLFRKKPFKKNFLNRSLSFSNEEISLVKPKDEIKIIVYSEGSPLIEMKLSGEKFLSSLIDIGAENYKLLKF